MYCMTKTKKISFRMTEKLYEKIKQKMQEKKINTMSSFVRVAIMKFIKEG